jgi:hypothetical protein
MYDKDDPRSALKSDSDSTRPSSGAAAPEYTQFNDASPQEVSAKGSPTWYFRGQNFTLSFTRLVAGDRLTRHAQEHEYVVILSETDTDVSIAAVTKEALVREPAVVVIPPGDSSLTAHRDTAVVRLFDARTEDILALAANRESYRTNHPNVALLVPWPEPVGGHKIRVYPTEGIPAEAGRFGRIFRTSSFMINFLDLQLGPRDPEKLSPHYHDDFEQCSLAVEGEYIHHIRTPWTAKRSEWRPDEHTRVSSPSATIIPPPTIHTSEAVRPGRNQLIDIFCPPREDFSSKEGWVLNAAEYPQP